MTKGIFLIAFGKRGYSYAAWNLAFSLKKFSPGLNITLWAGNDIIEHIAPEMRYVFDSITDIPQEMLSKYDPGKIKVNLYNYLPYDYNLVLDVDSLALHDIEKEFDKMIASGYHYYTSIQGTYQMGDGETFTQLWWSTPKQVFEHFHISEDAIFPATNSSWQFIKKCDKSEKQFNLTKEFYDNPIPISELKNNWGGHQPDELYLNASLAVVGFKKWENDIIFFGSNNNSRTDTQLANDFALLSFYGGRKTTKLRYRELYDRLMNQYIREKKMPYYYKMVHIMPDKMVNNPVKIQKQNNTSDKPQGQLILPAPANAPLLPLKSFYLNLERRKDRREKFEQRLSKLTSVKANRIESIDGKIITDIPDDFLPRYTTGLRKSKYATLQTHISAIEKAKENNYPQVLILEDDVCFSSNFDEALKYYLSAIPGDWKMIYLGRTNIQSRKPVERLKNTFGTFAYIVNSNFYDKLLVSLKNSVITVDDCIADVLQTSNACYGIYPFPVYVEDDFSDIENKNRSLSFIKVNYRNKLFLPRIKKIIHQIWLGDEYRIPQETKSWKEKHPDWEYKLWTEENIPANLICRKQFDFFMQRKLYNGASDILRLELLFLYGGIYIDADTLCINSLDDFMLNNELFCCAENEIKRPGILANGIMGAIEKNGFIFNMLNKIKAMNDAYLASVDPWKTVGTKFLSDEYNKTQYAGLRVYPSYLFLPTHFTGEKYNGEGKIYSTHFWGSTLNKYELTK